MPRTCADCGDTFTPARADAAYCSSACRQRAYRNRNRPSTIRNAVPVTAAEATVDYSTLTGTQREKLDRAKASIRRELEKEYRARLVAELDQRQAAMDEAFAKHKAEYDVRNARIYAMRDAERERYQIGIEAQRAKGLITVDQFNLLRSCLHPDSRNSVTDEKLAAAFRVFNDAKIKALLVKES